MSSTTSRLHTKCKAKGCFYQSLKLLVHAFCVQMSAYWEDTLPWLLLAAKQVTQESTGFSPDELVFGHTVRGPLAALQNDWKEAEPPQNLIDYVNGFRQQLYSAIELAKEKLSSAQGKMKRRADGHIGVSSPSSPLPG